MSDPLHERASNRTELYTAAFTGALAATTPCNPKLITALGAVVLFRIGSVLVLLVTVALTAAPDALVATTVALSLSIRVGGGSIGYSIYYKIFAEKIKTKLPAYIAEYSVKVGLPVTSAEAFVVNLTKPSAINTIPGVNAAVLEAALLGSRWACANSLSYVWYTSIAFGLCSIGACLLLPNPKNFLTKRIATRLH